MIKKFFNILISILLINILKVNSKKLFDDILSQFSIFTLGEQKLTVSKIPGRIAAKSNIEFDFVSSVAEGLNIAKTCDQLEDNYPYVVVTNGYVKTSIYSSKTF